MHALFAPRCLLTSLIRSNPDIIDAILEWVDNAFKALGTVPSEAAREVYYGFYEDEEGEPRFFVRDTGGAMSSIELSKFARLGHNPDAPPAPLALGGDPRKPFLAGLGQWSVGANTGIAALTSTEGRCEVTSRTRSDSDNVAWLVYEAASRLAAGQAGGMVLDGERRYQFDAGDRPATAVERGEAPEPRGGMWGPSGVLVEAVLPSTGLRALYRAELAAAAASSDLGAFNSVLAGYVATVYWPYISPAALAAFAPAPPLSDEAPAESGSHDSPIKKGKAKKGKASAGKATAVVPAGVADPATLKLYYSIKAPGVDLCIDCSKLNTAMMARMRELAGPHHFNVRLVFRCASRPGEVAEAHITMFYYPYTNGHETRPAELTTPPLSITHGNLIMYRCGRMLQQQNAPALAWLPLLGKLGWESDSRQGGRLPAELQAIKHALQYRTAGIIELDSAFVPKNDKSGLRQQDCPFNAALRALGKPSPAEIQHDLQLAGATVQVAVCGVGCNLQADEVGDPSVYRRLDLDGIAHLREQFCAWVSCHHSERDEEATQFTLEGEKPLYFLNPDSFTSTRDQFYPGEGPRHERPGDIFSGFYNMSVSGSDWHINSDVNATDQLRIFIPASANWQARLGALAGYCPMSRYNKRDGYLFTVRLAVTYLSSDPAPYDLMVVLDPWTVDPHVASNTGITLRTGSIGMRLTDLRKEMLDGNLMRVQLNHAIVRPMSNLQADGVCVVPNAEFWKLVGVTTHYLPHRIALVPQLWKQAVADGTARVECTGNQYVIDVNSGVQQLTDVPFALLLLARNQAAAPEGKPQPSDAWFSDKGKNKGDDKGKLIYTVNDPDGHTQRYTAQPGKQHPRHNELPKDGSGLYFCTLQLPVPGIYTLTLVADIAACPFACVQLPSLTYIVRVAAPVGLVAGQARCCVHPGACTGRGCQLLQAAREARMLDLQLHAAAPSAQHLFITQPRVKGAGATRWPAELGDDDHDRYEVSWKLSDSRREGECDVRFAQPPRLQVSSTGLELCVSGLQLGGGTLPPGFACTAREANRLPTAPLPARLTLTVVDTDTDAELVAEIAVFLAPGPLATLRPELATEEGDPFVPAVASATADLRALRAKFGTGLEAGQEATLYASLRDASGNLTTGAGLCLSPASKTNKLAVKEGLATIRLTVPADARKYEYRLEIPGNAAVVPLTIADEVPRRHLRLLSLPASAAALQAGACGEVPLAPMRALVVRGKGAASEAAPDVAFVGALLFSMAPAPNGAALPVFRPLPCEETPLLANALPTPLPTVQLLPQHRPGNYLLRVAVRGHDASEMRHDLRLTVSAGPPAKLKLPRLASRAMQKVVAGQEGSRFEVCVHDAYDNPVPITPELLAAASVRVVASRETGRGAAADEDEVPPPELRLVGLPVAGAAPGVIAFTGTLSGFPQIAHLNFALNLPGADDGDEAAAPVEMPQRISLVAGPPEAANSGVTVDGAARDENGAFLVSPGASYTLRVGVRDAAGNPVGDSTDVLPSVRVSLEGAPGMSLPANAMTNLQRDGSRTVALTVAATARPGAVDATLRAMVQQDKAEWRLPLKLRVQPSRHTSELATESADGARLDAADDVAEVQAGAPLTLFVRASCAAGGAPEPAVAPQLHLRAADAPGRGAAAQTVIVQTVEVASANGDDGTLYGIDPDAAAPTAAGDYAAEWVVAASGSARGLRVAAPAVRVVPCIDKPLVLVSHAPESRLELCGGGLLAEKLEVSLCDCYGNLAGEVAAAVGMRVRLTYEHWANAWKALPWPAGAAPEWAEVPLVAGVASFFGVIVPGDLPVGNYRLAARALGRDGTAATASASAMAFRVRLRDEGPGGGDEHERLEAEQACVAAEAAHTLAVAAHNANVALVDAATARNAGLRTAVALQGRDACTKAAGAAAAADAEACEPALTMPPPLPPYLLQLRPYQQSGAAPHVLFAVFELLRAEGVEIASALVACAGQRALAVVTRTRADARALEDSRCLGRSLLAMPLDDAVFLAGALPALLPGAQGQLDLADPGSPGFVGYLVNLVRLTGPQLAMRIAVPGRGDLGLRSAVLYPLFRGAMLFTTRAAMEAHFAKAGPGDGLFCLESTACVLRDGMRTGPLTARPAARAGVAAGATWRDDPLRRDVVLLREAAAAEAALRAAQAAFDATLAAVNAARAALSQARAALQALTGVTAPPEEGAAAGGRRRSAPAATEPDGKRRRSR